ncbi:MAG: SDH family Clp fold serine proteinase [Jatrophihabitantaceae bacterium]
MSQPTDAEFHPLLEQLRACRGNPVLLCHSWLAGDLVPVLYQCLRSVGGGQRLDLVLSSYGGSVTATRQVALLLREYADRLSILVPHRARSAGTLLCLSADELVLSPLAELGPLDANMSATELPAAGTPGVVSAEDIRAFPSMARDWFGVDQPADGLQLLAMLCQRIFPASLSSFYRLDKLIREVAAELLAYQLPSDQQARDQIVNRLVGGYHAHDYVLTRQDARQLGLRVTDASPEEERLLWEIASRLDRPRPDGVEQAAEQSSVGVVGIIAAAGFLARNVVRRRGGGSEPATGQSEWQIDG